MADVIIKTILTFLLSTALGYCLSTIKNYKKSRDEILNEFKELKDSQLCDMRSDLSSKFFIYDAMEEVEDYLLISWQEKCERYFHLGGDAYLHRLYEESKKWKIKPTGYLK